MDFFTAPHPGTRTFAAWTNYDVRPLALPHPLQRQHLPWLVAVSLLFRDEEQQWHPQRAIFRGGSDDDDEVLLLHIQPLPLVVYYSSQANLPPTSHRHGVFAGVL